MSVYLWLKVPSVQYACAILSSVTCPAPLYFSFLKQVLLNTKCVFWFSPQISSETFLTLRRIWRDIILHVHWSSCTVPLLLSEFNETWIFSTVFEKYSDIKFHENPSSGSQLVPWGQTDRHRKTDMSKLLDAFRNFAKRAQKHTVCQMVGWVGTAPASPLSQHRLGALCSKKRRLHNYSDVDLFFNPNTFCSK